MEWEWRFLLKSDPAADLSQVTVPTCIAAGTADTQVNPDKDLEGTRTALTGGLAPSVHLLSADGLNHLFQEAHGGQPSAYDTLGPPFTDAFVRQLAAWMVSQLPGAMP